MSKILFLTICFVLIIFCVESALIFPGVKSSDGKLKISIEIGAVDEDVNECNDDCKGKCNETCGPDARCRYKCYVEDCKCPKKLKKSPSYDRYELVGCTTKCKEYCNNTCGEDLKCRDECYVKTCQCPHEFENDDSDEDNESHQISGLFSKHPKLQCCPVCMKKCLHRCDKDESKCKKYCKSKCCHDPSEWN